MHGFVDIGGTNIRIGISANLKQLEGHLTFKNPKDYRQALELISGYFNQLMPGKQLADLVIGVAGTLNRDRNQLTASPQLVNWIDQPLAEDLSDLCNTVVYLYNDAALSALAESTRGAGQNFKIVGYLTISTGVGGAKVINQKIDGPNQAFEPGRMIINNQQTLGDLLSGMSIYKQTGHHPEEIDEPVFWQKKSEILVKALNNLSVDWQPDCFVLGGSISTKFDFDLLNRELSRYLDPHPIILKSKLGDLSGLIGGMVILKQIRQNKDYEY